MRQPSRLPERLRRAFAEFLSIPSLVIAGFLILAIGVYWIDSSAGPRDDWGAVKQWLDRYVGDAASATGLLETIAGGLITVTSITFSILLLAVQQGAAALTSQVVDQYLRRPANQLYFGFFVGASMFALITLVLANDAYRPVFGATVAVLLAGSALLVLVLLIYTTINQTRPATIINAIHDEALLARDRQADFLSRTAECPEGLPIGQPVVSDKNGYVTRLDMGHFEKITQHQFGTSIELRVSLGDYLPCGDTIAIVRGSGRPTDQIAQEVRWAVDFEEKRDLGSDPAFGVDQLSNIAWTSISTAKSNPGAGLIACHALQDLLWRWSTQEKLDMERADASSGIFYKDTVSEQLFDAFEALVVVASESMQHQSLGVVMSALAATFPEMPKRWKDRTEDLLLRSLASLGDHAPTRILEVRFQEAADALAADGRENGASKLLASWARLAATKGELHSRGTRAGR